MSIIRSVALVVAVISIACFTQFARENSNEHSKLCGVWNGNYNNVQIQMNFHEDSTCRVEFYDQLAETVLFFTCRYIVSFKYNPPAMSITSVKPLNHSLHTIIEFADDDTMKMAAFAHKRKLRPLSFEPDKTIVLAREEVFQHGHQ